MVGGSYWLATVAKELREAAGRKQVQIAPSISKDQSTVYRFEVHKNVPPRDIDVVRELSGACGANRRFAGLSGVPLPGFEPGFPP
jgi:hypothetical protein